MSNAPAAIPTLTIPQLKAFYAKPELRACLRALAKAKLEQATTRKHVDSYVERVFAGFAFYNDAEVEHGEERQRVTGPARLYLSKDEAQCAKFYAACDKAHKLNGYDVPTGHCPALTAESKVTDLENVLLSLASKHFGVDFRSTWGKLRERALALFINGPGKVAA